MRYLALAAIALSAATPAMAQTPAARPAPPSSSPVQMSDEDVAAGRSVAEALLPRNVADKLFVAAFEASAERTFRAEGEDQVYSAHPGMREYIWVPLRAEARLAFNSAIPSLYEAMGKTLASDMSPAEMREIALFLRSGVGSRMLQMIYEMFDDGPLAPGESEAQRQRFMRSLTSAERRDLSAFEKSSAARKFVQVLSASRQTGKFWSVEYLKSVVPKLRETYARLRREYLERGKTTT